MTLINEGTALKSLKEERIAEDSIVIERLKKAATRPFPECFEIGAYAGAFANSTGVYVPGPQTWSDISTGPTDSFTVSTSFDDSFAKKDLDIPEEIKYKYNEGQIVADFKAYLDKTYTEHYKTGDEDSLECFDAWIALGDSTPTFRNTALKYLWRYGKKNGSNKADLMKTLHYTLMCLHVDHYKDK